MTVGPLCAEAVPTETVVYPSPLSVVAVLAARPVRVVPFRTPTTTLKGLGYTTVSVGTASAQSGPTVIYYREGAKAAADRLATDLLVETVTELAGTPLEQSAAAGTQLVVLLGA